MIVVLELILLIRIFGFLIRHECISPGAKNRYFTSHRRQKLTFDIHKWWRSSNQRGYASGLCTLGQGRSDI